MNRDSVLRFFTRTESGGAATLYITMKQILLIDDDIELCALLTDYLQAEGFEVEAVHNGESGLQKALSGNLQYRRAGCDVARNLGTRRAPAAAPAIARPGAAA